MLRATLLSFFLVSSLFGEKDTSQHKLPVSHSSSIAHTPPSSFVNNTHVISGGLFFSGTSFTVPSAHPLQVSHSYNGEGAFYTWMGFSSFSFNFPVSIHGGSPIAKSDGTIGLVVEEGNGSGVQYLARFYKPQQTSFDYYLDPELLKTGFTNCSGGEVSARTNSKNTLYTLHIKPIPHHHKYKMVVWEGFLSDGTYRKYYPTEYYTDAMNLQYEQFPSGHKAFYDYYNHGDYLGFLKRVRIQNYNEQNTLSTLKFSQGILTKKI